MHIGYVVKRYPRFSETFIVNEILAHERAGVPVEIFAVRRVNEPYFQSILGQVRSPVHYISDSTPKAEGLWTALKDGAKSLPGFWDNLERFRNEELPDVLQGIHLAIAARKAGVTHLHAHFATVATTVARIAACFAGIGYSVTAHAKDIFHADIDPLKLRPKLADAKAVVTVSDFNVDYLATTHGFRPPHVQRIYNGLWLDEFPYSSPAIRPKHIVAVGRLVEKKGFSTLVEACALLDAAGQEFTCEIIGDGPQRADLAQRIEESGLSDKVRLAGALPRPNVITALQSAAVSALPCIVADDGDRDGLPTVLVEAMALGTPCVSTDVTGVPEVVKHGTTGLCIEQRNPKALAEALGAILENPAMRERLASEARAMIERDFDVDQNAAYLRTFFSARAATVALRRAAG
ncbi:glycosyltransferase family 4 protein [Sphingorhabdus lacus]|uniref:Colanic acid biosynthesis glycosyltransferase WcaL n=1 Tax=Sphingorhabdus lacus TaxID=392610 RepID=A0A6I6L8K2_9SPHN|nr:glycosyltransferase family 4 protein [Sphingorhabdus lacus]QGY81124.1 colanic acid biosynthesis glycosyltransferase WcaL [Sphingorhabdus lacus]